MPVGLSWIFLFITKAINMHLKRYLLPIIFAIFYFNGFSSNKIHPYKIKNTSFIEKIALQKDTLGKFKNDSIKKFRFGGSNFVSTRFIPRSGVQLGDGFVNQTFLKVNYSKFTAWSWINYGLEEGAFQEVDFGIEYRDLLAQNFLNGTLHFMVGASNFNFPTLELSNLLFEGSLSYKGVIEVDVISTNVIKSKKVRNTGSRLYAEIRKPIPFKIRKLNTELIPMLSSAYHWGFYGFEELAHISPGVKYKLHFSKVSISTFLNYQFSSKDVIAIGDNQNFLFGGLGIEF